MPKHGSGQRFASECIAARDARCSKLHPQPICLQILQRDHADLAGIDRPWQPLQHLLRLPTWSLLRALCTVCVMAALCMGFAFLSASMQSTAAATTICSVLLGLLFACSPKRAETIPYLADATDNQRREEPVLRDSDQAEIVAVFLPEQTVELAASVSAPIVSLHAQLGSEVAQGELLVQLDARKIKAELLEQQAALLAIQTECELRSVEQAFSTKLHHRSAAALRAGGISDVEVERAQQESIRSAARSKQCLQELEQRRAHLQVLQAELHRAEIRAPFHGRVAALYVSVGATVQSAEPLLRLVGMGPQLVRMAVPASLSLQIGQPLFVGNKQDCWTLQLLRVAPSVDDALGLRIIEARLLRPAPPSLLYVRASLRSSCDRESRS